MLIYYVTLDNFCIQVTVKKVMDEHVVEMHLTIVMMDCPLIWLFLEGFVIDLFFE